MEALSEYVVVIVMAICLAVGYIIKHFLPLDNKWIPLIMGALGIVLNIWSAAGLYAADSVGRLASGWRPPALLS